MKRDIPEDISTRSRAGFPFIMFRIWSEYHRNPAFWKEMFDMVKRYQDVCNEVWFCMESGFRSIQKHCESAAMMARAANELRSLGIEAGMQIPHTIGHGGALSSFKNEVGTNWQRFTNHDGTEVGNCICPRDPGFLDYLHQMAGIYAEAVHPSSVWIDDDLRMHAHPPADYGCFCDRCIGEFSKSQGHVWTRDSLVSAFFKPDEFSLLRVDWVKFGIASMAGLAETIATAVAEKAPECRMGLQQCSLDWSSYYGPDLKPVFSAMEKATGLKPGSRLGHGYYHDHAPRELLVKSFGIARQVERASGAVEQVCPEVENFVHAAMGKSPRGTAIESALHLAMGCNSLSYALCTDLHHEGPEWLSLFFDKFREWRPLWELIVSYNKDTALGGLDIVLGRQQAGRPVNAEGDPWNSFIMNFGEPIQLSAIGLPLCPDSSLASAAIITSEAASGLTSEELRRLFSGGVLLDGPALEVLQKRDLGFDLGVSAEKVETAVYERLSGDELNKASKDARWCSYQGDFHSLSFNGCSHRILGSAFSINDDVPLGCVTALVENSLGGRMGILGYNGFQNNISSAKRMQLLEMADWISRGRLPVILETPAQVVVCPRLDRLGELKCVTLLNASIGETQPLSLRFRTKSPCAVTLFSAEGPWILPLETRKEGDETLVAVPPLDPWSLVFLTLDYAS